MTDTNDELKAQTAHEARMIEDPEYRLQFEKDSVYGDLENFKEFFEAHDMFPIIARELLRAISNANLPDKHSMAAVEDAIDNIRDEFDAKIKYVMEQKQ